MNKYNNIIIVDDDPVSNYVCNMYIKLLLPEMPITSYLNPLEALEKFSIEMNKTSNIMFLDINMPQLNGWQFLEKFQKEKFKMDVIILSSSISKTDKEKIHKFPEVIDFLIKPITKDNLRKFFL